MNKNKDFAEIEEFILKYDEFVTKEFGNWKKLIDIIKGTQRKSNIRYTDEEILNSLKEFYYEFGDEISVYKYKKLKRTPKPTTITRRFGSWNKAIKAAGIDIENKPKARFMSDTEILEVLKEAKSEINGEFNTEKYDNWAKENDKIRLRSIYKRFITWENALKLAELEKTQDKTQNCNR